MRIDSCTTNMCASFCKARLAWATDGEAAAIAQILAIPQILAIGVGAPFIGFIKCSAVHTQHSDNGALDRSGLNTIAWIVMG